MRTRTVRTLRGKLLEEALRSTRKIASKPGDGPSPLLLEQDARRIARIHNATGLRTDAKRTYLRAIEGLGKLRDEDRPIRIPAHLSGAHHDSRQHILRVEGSENRRSGIQEGPRPPYALLALKPDYVEYQILCGPQLWLHRRPGASGKGKRRGGDLLLSFLAQTRSDHYEGRPDDPDAAYEFARSHNNLGQLAIAQGNPARRS